MNVKLENLIEKIRQEGVLEAKKISEEIINSAKNQATKIVDDAKKERNRILKESKQEITQFKKNAEGSIRQAARDTVLLVRQQLVGMLENILKRNISQTLTPGLLKQLLIKIIDRWSPQKELALDILVSKEDKEKLQNLIFSEIKEEARKKITVKVSNGVSKGFCIGIKGEDTYYDFSDESIVETLKMLLNPAISAILDNQDG